MDHPQNQSTLLTNIPEEEMTTANSNNSNGGNSSSRSSDITADFAHEDDHLSIHFDDQHQDHHHLHHLHHHHHHHHHNRDHYDSPEFSVSRPNSSVFKHCPQSSLHQPSSPLPSSPQPSTAPVNCQSPASTFQMDTEDLENGCCYGDELHKQLTSEIELVFENIAYSLNTEGPATTNTSSSSSNTRPILSSINGHAAPGQVLAVMGASGSGKTTLLNLLSGRIKPTSGSITLNGTRLNKQQRRRICYVLQQDIFFPSLTLKQTLMYTARLRLPQSMADSEKQRLVEKLISELHLTQCQNTAIGDVSQRGLSGGEKKRVNIACELLTNPSVMLIDEPTSGLDSCTAHSLVATIKRFAVEKRKTIIMTVHQPSSQMFYMFDQLLLLANGGGSGGGRLAYFGPVNGVVPFFGSLGHNIDLHYNPADYILEVVATKGKNGEGGIDEIIDAAAAEAARRKSGDDHHHHHHHHHHHWKKTASLKSIELSEVSEVKFSDCNQSAVSMGDHHTNDHHHHHHHHSHHHHHHLDSDSGRSSWSEPDRSSEVSLEQPSSPQPLNKENGHVSLSMGCQQEEMLFKNLNKESQQKKNSPSKKAKTKGSLSKKQPPKWPTSMWTQVRVLTERNFTEAKSRMLSKLNWIQTVVLAVLAGLIWYRPTRTEETIEDIRGWMFFTTTYWMLFGLFQALVSFPAEREVVNKERASGAYRLSAYYLAKMAGELPLTVALPSVFFFISYPMLAAVGDNHLSLASFLACWAFLLLSTVCAQSVGLFIGAACADLEVSVTSSALYSLSTMLFAGYYTAMPPWLSWARYASMVYYAFLNMQLVEFGGSSGGILCSKTASKFAYCQQFYANNSTATSATPAIIPYSELKLQLDLMNLGSEPTPLWFNSLVLIGFLVAFRTMGYLVLRFGRKVSA